MNIISRIMACICMMLPTGVLPEATGWHSIVPLHSTRADVERLLGYSANAGDSTYKLENEVVLIHYSTGPCSKDRKGGWNVPLNTVTGITIGPKLDIRFTNLQLSREKYKRIIDAEMSTHVLYTNKEEGISYEVFEGGGEKNGLVLSIYYEPSAKDSHLRCSCA